MNASQRLSPLSGTNAARYTSRRMREATSGRLATRSPTTLEPTTPLYECITRITSLCTPKMISLMASASGWKEAAGGDEFRHRGVTATEAYPASARALTRGSKQSAVCQDPATRTNVGFMVSWDRRWK